MSFKLVDTNSNGETTFLGRTSTSWFKILLFYVIYYSCLSALIYFTVITYANKMPVVGDNQPKITTRVDMPGSSVQPFNLMQKEFDSDDRAVIEFDLTDDKKFQTNAEEYVGRFHQFYRMNSGWLNGYSADFNDGQGAVTVDA